MKFRLRWLAAVAIMAYGAMIATSASARADAFTTFDLGGEFVTSPFGKPVLALSGTVTVDTTSGVVTGANVFNGEFGPPTIIFQGTQEAIEYLLVLATAANRVILAFPVVTLVNYAGGNLLPNPGMPFGSVSYFTDASYPDGLPLLGGTATAEPVAEPGSMGLLLAAIGGFALFARRRSATG